MTLPPDPFEDWPPEGLEKALESFDDPEAREAMREFVRELDKARFDAPALVDQPNPFTLLAAVQTLDDDRARAALFWTVLALIQQMRGPGYLAWLEGS